MRSIAVAGAGLAGLVIATRLRERGHDVRVFEARRRAGGRIRTLRSPFADGQFAEAGARYIRSYHSRALELIDEFGLELLPVHPSEGDHVIYLEGQRLRTGSRTLDWPATLNLDADEVAGPGRIWAKATSGAIPSGSRPAALNLDRYDRMTVAEFLRQSGVSSGGIELVRLGLQQAIGEGIESYSALSALRLARHPGEKSTSWTIKGGTDRLPRKLARRLRGLIEYNARVVAIGRENGRATVAVRQGGTERSFQADAVILSVPLPALRRIVFRPEMPMEKRHAIDALPYTSVCRVFLQYPRRAWEGEGLSGLAYTDLPIHRCLNATTEQDGKHGILDVYVTGSVARTLARLDEKGRIRFAQRYLTLCFPRLGEDSDPLVAGATVAWDQDPWAGGGYVWFKPGQVLSEGEAIRKPEGPLYFAGEHTSDWPGWMEGAIQSAERVLQEVTDVL